MQVTYILLKAEHPKPIPELTDLAAGRVYTMNSVEDVTATVIDEETAKTTLLISKVLA